MDNLLEHGSQITLLITIIFGGIGYLFKLFFDWNIKKKEIVFNKLKETRISALKDFYKSYVDLEMNLKGLRFACAFDDKDHEKEIRKKLPDSWKYFSSNFIYLRLFLYKNELVLFDKINGELNNVQLKVDLLRIGRDSGNIELDLQRELRFITDEIFPKKLPELLREIENNVRIDFNIKNK